jgi:hypothetical protein
MEVELRVDPGGCRYVSGAAMKTSPAGWGSIELGQSTGKHNHNRKPAVYVGVVRVSTPLQFRSGNIPLVGWKIRVVLPLILHTPTP